MGITFNSFRPAYIVHGASPVYSFLISGEYPSRCEIRKVLAGLAINIWMIGIPADLNI